MNESSKIYELLVDTLIMVCPDITIVSDSDIEDYLSELEGDYYTFFDIASLSQLYLNGLLSENQMNKIVELKNTINEIPLMFWNVECFQKEIYWKKARQLANDILNSLGISKRQI